MKKLFIYYTYYEGEEYKVYTLNKDESDTIIVYHSYPFVLRKYGQSISIDSLVVKFDNLREIIAVRKSALQGVHTIN